MWGRGESLPVEWLDRARPPWAKQHPALAPNPEGPHTRQTPNSCPTQHPAATALTRAQGPGQSCESFCLHRGDHRPMQCAPQNSPGRACPAELR